MNTRYVAMLDDVPPGNFKTVSFDDWWGKPIFIDKDRQLLTRKDVVLIAANQDGGAHIDPHLDARYAELATQLGWVAVDNHVARIMEGPERVAIRQIAHELLRTLDPTYTKKPAHAAGMIIGMPSIIEGGPEDLPPVPKAQRKMGRNEPCFCGSNLKYKRCHGRLA